ncbi:DUF4248 domain-containing protein [Bacteroides sp.]
MKSTNFSFNLDGCPCVKDVAEAYFPQYKYSRTAIMAFRKKIATTPELLKELLEAEYNEKEKHLTPKQMIAIATHWGKPGDLRVFLHIID